MALYSKAHLYVAQFDPHHHQTKLRRVSSVVRTLLNQSVAVVVVVVSM
jgi:adenylylsulfate kinase-like enzyme